MHSYVSSVRPVCAKCMAGLSNYERRRKELCVSARHLKDVLVSRDGGGARDGSTRSFSHSALPAFLEQCFLQQGKDMNRPTRPGWRRTEDALAGGDSWASTSSHKLTAAEIRSQFYQAAGSDSYLLQEEIYKAENVRALLKAVNADRPSLKPRNVTRAVRRLHQLGLSYMTPQLEADVVEFLKFSRKHLEQHLHKYSPQNLAEMAGSFAALSKDLPVRHISKTGLKQIGRAVAFRLKYPKEDMVPFQMRDLGNIIRAYSDTMEPKKVQLFKYVCLSFVST
jgi:hypothetical protein